VVAPDPPTAVHRATRSPESSAPSHRLARPTEGHQKRVPMNQGNKWERPPIETPENSHWSKHASSS